MRHQQQQINTQPDNGLRNFRRKQHKIARSFGNPRFETVPIPTIVRAAVERLVFQRWRRRSDTRRYQTVFTLGRFHQRHLISSVVPRRDKREGARCVLCHPCAGKGPAPERDAAPKCKRDGKPYNPRLHCAPPERPNVTARLMTSTRTTACGCTCHATSSSRLYAGRPLPCTTTISGWALGRPSS